jgi:hypothetical protein
VKARTALLISSLVLALGVATGCAGSAAYRKASAADTPDAYRAYLSEHPKDSHADSARLRLSELEFERASQAHSLLAYKRFLDQFPDAPQASDAKKRLEALRFNVAAQKDTAAGWRDFLSEEPDGAHHVEARGRLHDAELKALAAKGDLSALAQRLDPADPRYAQVQGRLDDQRFGQARATGTARLLAYLKDFPAGAHRLEAETELLSRRLEGLLFSGHVEEAKVLAAKSPLAAKLQDLPQRIARAEEAVRVRGSHDPLIQAALAANYVRSVDDLLKAVHAPDSLDRWEAVEELGQHLDVRVIDPLLVVLRTGRNALIRQRALESLQRLFSGLPRAIADYEIATRLATLREEAGSPALYLSVAVLEDLSGALARAAVDYQRAFEPRTPDPVILRRWVGIRKERGEAFSAAVAARQLALWAKETSAQASLSPKGGIVLVSARDACAAVAAARFAADAIQEAQAHKTEFPEDLDAFLRDAKEAVELSQAKLADAEILLRTQSPGAPVCTDQRVRERIAAGQATRLEALGRLEKKDPARARVLYRLALQSDPSAAIREVAARVLGEGPKAASSTFRGEPGARKVRPGTASSLHE